MTLKLNVRWTTPEVLAARDRYRQNAAEMEREEKAFTNGRRIAAGETHPGLLDTIIRWKSPRPLGRIKTDNPTGEIAEALGIAARAEHVRTALGVLCGLSGVDVAMASAILTTIHPERYTVIDWRALKALEVSKSSVTISDYLTYLDFCNSKSAELRLSLRDLDQALWVLGG